MQPYYYQTTTQTYPQQFSTNTQNLILIPTVYGNQNQCSCICSCQEKQIPSNNSFNSFIIGQINENSITTEKSNNGISEGGRQKDNNVITLNMSLDTINESNELEYIRHKLCISDSIPIEISDPDESIKEMIPKGMVIPKIECYRHIRIYKPQRKRWQSQFLCKFENCNSIIKKWGNLFDHLRAHVNERPYKCPVDGCDRAFTQKSNLEKHMKTHRRCYLRCGECKQIFTKHKIIRHFLSVHQEEKLENEVPRKSMNDHETLKSLQEVKNTSKDENYEINDGQIQFEKKNSRIFKQ
ncbi:zinc finger protein zic 3 [Stylonychia lemnae]|uniref:Zinc finger protein zic 3 n=1 Tax=Stylonychia lemnae TaxID=5949 RepID=A0A078ABY2_STYLE|nr:zinc finger protein zic 3 [Stylonychia lemnae]|eukprot:CDW79102.1 zinc finger protein zic 3 [Stylonychia lemnae]